MAEMTADSGGEHGRGRPARSVPPSAFVAWPTAQHLGDRLMAERDDVANLPSTARPEAWPASRSLLVATVVNSTTAAAAMATGSTSVGLISCTATSICTIGLVMCQVRRRHE